MATRHAGGSGRCGRRGLLAGGLGLLAAGTGLPALASPGEAVVAQAMLLVNTPYRWGGNTPDSGFDCSGLVRYVFNEVMGQSRALPRTTAEWAHWARPIAREQLRRGDLVFFNTSGSRYSHMGVYVGNNQFVHAPSRGKKVHKTSLSNPYFARRFVGAARVLTD